ncbi:MAG: antitoxin component YwqK of YwqJK toxin-antitoxin module, partial [Sphingobacteriales bacterium]
MGIMFKKCFLLSIMVMGSFLVFGQKNAKDEKGEKHGFWTELHPNSSFKRYEGNFEHGNPVGEFKRYYQTGQIESKVQYRGDSTFIRSFFMEGGLLAEGIYIDQKKEGKWKFYSGNGFLISAEFYTEGVRNGESIVYSEKGKVVSEAIYSKGTLNGPFLINYPNGVIKEERTYANGNIVGKEIKRYPNNKIMMEGVYNSEGLRDGWYIEYLPSGEEKLKYLYSNGIGDSTVYV